MDNTCAAFSVIESTLVQQIPSSKICRKVYDANIKHYEKEKKYQEQFSIFLVLIFKIICYIEIKEGGQRKGCLTSQTCWKLVYITLLWECSRSVPNNGGFQNDGKFPDKIPYEFPFNWKPPSIFSKLHFLDRLHIEILRHIFL